MEQRETSLKEQNAEKKAELDALKKENESLTGRTEGLAKRRALQEDEVARTTRTEAQISLDRTFHKRFPSLPASEIAIDYFGCATVAHPGWIYIGTEFLGWEPAMNPLVGKSIIPISHITRMDKIRGPIGIRNWLFDVYVEPTIAIDERTQRGDKVADVVQKPLQASYTFRSAKWRELFDTVQRQAERAGRTIKLTFDGKDL